MKKTLFTFIAALFLLSAKAQKQDTTIYPYCHTAENDHNIDGVDGDGNIFDSCPQFKNGFDDLFKYISSHIHYPNNARKKKIEGRVIIGIIIEKDGNVSNAKILRGISDELDEESLRVINSLPKWKPAILHGKPARVRYSIVVGFKLPGKKR